MSVYPVCADWHLSFPISFDTNDPQLDTMDTAIKISSAENPELSKIPSVKPGVCPNTALYAFSTARNSTLQMFTFIVHLTSYSQFLFPREVMCVVNGETFTCDLMTHVLPL